MNKLEKETSPYLLEHKHNPVEWYAWNSESLNLSKRKNKPILLSIGYSACHWCHVMAKESFENKDIAKLMNDNFINIKVDREERPDLDAIYQNALSILGEQGGWPLTIFLTPKCEPFWGGTYFPPISKFGRPGFQEVLQTISRIFNQEKEKIKQSVELIKTALERSSKNISGPGINKNIFNQVCVSLIKIVDKDNGGIQGAPKFPNIPIFKLIFNYLLSNPDKNTHLHELIINTLNKMCCGGIYDHVGGGFARYSTDAKWLVPHFEKMLYDNAQIIEFLILGYQQYKSNEFYKTKIEETIQWVLREMKIKSGGLASSIDADSEGEEGKFYLWTKKEIKKILNKEGDSFCEKYNISDKGNWENKNILFLTKIPTKKELNENKKKLYKLFISRKKRVGPGLDDKVLTDSNCLMINALAVAGWTFNNKLWLDESEKIYNFIIENLFYKKQLYHSWKKNKVKTFATFDDYTNLLRCSITLYEKTNKENYLKNSQNFFEIILKKFKDKKGGGYFTTSNETKDVIVKLKSIYDTATPSGVGLMIQSSAKLYYITGEKKYYDEANEILKSISGNIEKNFFSSSSILNGYDILENGVQIILVIKKDYKKILNEIKKLCIPNKIILLIKTTKNLKKGHPAYGKKNFKGKTTVYICKNQTCSLPILTKEDLKKKFKKFYG